MFIVCYQKFFILPQVWSFLHKEDCYYRLLPRHIAERRTNCRLLYENHLSGEKWKFVVTLDETWVHLSYCGDKRAIFYKKRGEKNTETLFRECRESFPKGFMVVAGFSYNGKLTIRKIEKNAKINSKYYQDKILIPIFEKTSLLCILWTLTKLNFIKTKPRVTLRNPRLYSLKN